jgi:hypothetical protein
MRSLLLHKGQSKKLAAPSLAWLGRSIASAAAQAGHSSGQEQGPTRAARFPYLAASWWVPRGRIQEVATARRTCAMDGAG